MVFIKEVKPIRTEETDGKSTRVRTLHVLDETGEARLAVWESATTSLPALGRWSDPFVSRPT